MCIFSTHNLVGDPPFSRLDLLSCRNLLIYLEAEIAEAARPALPLRPRALGGYLLLGPSENLADYLELFRAVDKERAHLPAAGGGWWRRRRSSRWWGSGGSAGWSGPSA